MKCIVVILFLLLFSCKSREEISSVYCYELTTSTIKTKENAVTINYALDIDKVLNPEKILFLTLHIKEKITTENLYKFKNINSLVVFFNDNIDLNQFKLSEYKNLCSIDIRGGEKLQTNTFENFFKDINYISHLKLDEFSLANKNLIKYLPRKIDCLEVVFNNYKGNKINIELLNCDLNDFEINKLVFNPRSYVGNSFYKTENKKYYPLKSPHKTNKDITLYSKNLNIILEKFLNIKSLEKLIIKNAYLGQLTSRIENGENLKSLKFFNCFITEIPNEIKSLNELETLTLFNEEELNNDYKYPEIKIADRINGLKALKNLYMFNIDLSSFPEFDKSNEIENFIYIGNGEIKQFPEFFRLSKESLKSLTWNNSKVNKIPDYLNNLKVKVLNLNNNKLKTINNILDAATNAEYFTYDLNNISHKDRQSSNAIIKLNRKKIVDTQNELEKIADSIYYGFQNNLLYKRIVYGFNSNTGLYRNEIFFPEDKKSKYNGSYNETVINEFYHYINLSKEYNFDIGYLGNYKNCTEYSKGIWTADNADFEDYLEVLNSKPSYPFYYKDSSNQYCNEQAQKTNGFISNKKTIPFIYRNLSDIKEARTSRIAFLSGKGPNTQKEFNDILKAKKIKNIVSKRIILDSIPQCFYELKMDTIQIELFEMKKPFTKDFKYPSTYFRTDIYGNVPSNIKHLYIGGHIKETPKKIYLPNLKVLVKEIASLSEIKNSCYEYNIFPSEYLITSRALDSIHIISNVPDARICFEKTLPKFNSRYLSIGYTSPKKLSPFGSGNKTIEIIGFPKFNINSKIEELNIKGKFTNVEITNSISNISGLRKIKLENVLVDFDKNKKRYQPKIDGLARIFKNIDLEDLTLVNFNINQLSSEIKEAKNLKRLTIKNDYGKFSELSFKDLKKETLNKIPEELLELKNLQEIYLQVNMSNLDLDFSLLPKLKKLTIEGITDIPASLIKELEKNNVLVTILK